MNLPVVYFFQRGDLIKIGTTVDLVRRIRELPPGELLATEPGDRLREHALHGQFADHRFRGEWFRSHPDLTSYIAALPIVEELPRQRPNRETLRNFDLYNRITAGHLWETLVTLDKDHTLQEITAGHLWETLVTLDKDHTLQEITSLIRRRYQVDVSSETVRRWLEHLVTA